MKKRMIILRIDDLTRIIRDYMLAEDAPQDMAGVKIMVNPAERNAIGLMVESDEWDGYLGEQRVVFDLKRYFGVKGVS